ncbi:MAG: sulfotransferase family protein [Synechococcus sp.]|jgi:dermatan 4-sulfotransferase 1|nr:sulfotransferase family protein [Synechococcus sp.]
MAAAMGQHIILFERLPLMYARVPKVANSSVKAALTRLLEQPPEEGFRTTADAFWQKGTHGETRMIDAAEALQRRSSHFSFSFVRNPFDRLVSAYNNKLIENDTLSTAMQRMGLARQMSFRDFLAVVASTPDADLDVHLLPQTSMLCVDGIPVPGFIGQMEAMADHWQLLRRRMRQAGLPALGKLPTKNMRRGGDSDLTGHFNDDTLIDLALGRYRDDVRLFYGDHDLAQLARGQLSAAAAPLERSAPALAL